MHDDETLCGMALGRINPSKPQPVKAFTPGPWIVEREPQGLYVLEHSNDSYFYICEFFNNDTPTALLNAQLIAAAPDQNDALETFPTDMSCGANEYIQLVHEWVIKKCGPALARARGEQG